MDKITIRTIIIGIIVLLIICPTLINTLMFFDFFNIPVKGDETIWIPTLGTFWGALIGGVISGALTLIGVRMTIQNQKNEEFTRMYPRLLLLGDEITASLKHFLEESNVNDLKPVDIVSSVRKYHSISRELLVKASNINGFVYENYKNINGYFYYFNKYLNDNSSYNEWGEIEYDFDDKEIQHYMNLIKDCLEYHEKLILEISNDFLNLTVVDRVPKKWKRRIRKDVEKIKKELEK